MTAENNEEIVTMDNHAPAPPVGDGPKPLDNHAPVAPTKGTGTATTQGDNHAPVPPKG
ncbi:hypothetical protein [Streptomyces liangshanensis]|uniref:Sigma-like protein n=1 Tax=Streptomyces liangshanensis TaxID=2717324 RepID=A0A6G9H2C1_9ACTN|nr:hypothetical protein [Streptomyces liangshanensis]QIQ04277.1 hypothetical protein HA039_19960 [Streptomyces liangshanensis]